MREMLPLTMDLFALFMFLGVIQSFFLAYFFFRKGQTKNSAFLFLSLLLFSVAFLVLEVFLCYSNYMFRVLYLVDFSEPFNLLPMPLFYLYLRQELGLKKQAYQWLHIAPFVLWLVYSIVWQFQSLDFKYNAYLGAYYPEMDQVISQEIIPYSLLRGRWVINYLFLGSICLYSLFSWMALSRYVASQQQTIWKSTDRKVRWLRDWILFLISLAVVFLTTKLWFKEDLGDHFIVTWVTIFIYVLNYRVLSTSHLYPGAPEKPKYEKSSLSSDQEDILLQKLATLFAEEKPYLDNTISLPALSKKLNVSTHHLSQLINQRRNQRFFEMIAEYRVQEAREMLQNPANHLLKIEEIAERVGYNSKSAFNTAFKKYTGKTPSAFRKQHS